ncbi:MAG: hypothetical protein WAU56_18260 [Steroidobacteraceae bacterium]
MAAAPQDVGRKLPIALQDVSQWMQVSLESWSALLVGTGESGRLTQYPLNHESLVASFAANCPNDETFEAIETIFELGSDEGRNRIVQAAEDQQVDLQTSDDEPTPELVARLCLKRLTDQSVANILTLALINVREVTRPRPQREFAARNACSADHVTKEQVGQGVSAWCRKNGKSEAVEILTFRRDGIWHCEILRGDPLKRVPEIRDNKIGILTFRPVASDHVQYDPQTGRLSIATRSPQLCRAYRELFGKLIADDSRLFGGDALYTLRPLQVDGAAAFEAGRPPEILRVDLVELRARLNDREDIFVRGRDCFHVLREFGANIKTGELTEARLKVSFAGQRRPGHVSIKVPNQLMLKASGREEIIKRFLGDIGIIGSFDENGQPATFWSQYPWRMHESDWRPHLGSEFDRLLSRGFLQPVVLDIVRDPGSGFGYLNVRTTDDGTYVGVSDDVHVPPRTLTLSDVQGYQLDLLKVMHEIRSDLSLNGQPVEVCDGLWSLGTRAVGSHDLKVLLASRQLSEAAVQLVSAQTGKERPILLLPRECSVSIGIPQLPCRIPIGPYDTLFGDALERLGLQDLVPLPDWRTEDFLVDNRAGLAWYRRVRLTELSAASQPFKFAREVARAGGNLVTSEFLLKQLSPAEGSDPQVTKKAKSHFIKAVKASYEKAGKTCPPDIHALFEARSSRGYVLTGKAYVRM